MPKKWLVNVVDILFTVLLLGVFVLGLSWFLEGSATLVLSLVALIFSALSFYRTVFRPVLLKPQLKWLKEIQLSEPTYQEIQAYGGVKRSWFIRLKVVNDGLTPARNCVGRLVEVRHEDGKRFNRFDPFNLYWARQNRPGNFRPVDIQGHSDFFFLDIAQVIEAKNILSLRVVIPEGERLVLDSGLGEGSELPPGTYFVRIAVYAEEAVNIERTWFRIKWEADYTIDPPCTFEFEKPPFY